MPKQEKPKFVTTPLLPSGLPMKQHDYQKQTKPTFRDREEMWSFWGEGPAVCHRCKTMPEFCDRGALNQHEWSSHRGEA